MKTRKLKVDRSSQNPDNPYGGYPRIRLQGKWLTQEAGFSPNQTVFVYVTQPGLILIKDTPFSAGTVRNA